MNPTRTLPRAALLALALAAPTHAATLDSAPVYVAGSQYSAVFHQSRALWQLTPADGRDLLVGADACHSGRRLPEGLWLLTRDAQDRPVLVAPSATMLPASGSAPIPLRGCDAAGKTDIAVPQPLLDLLVANTGAVYVAD